MTENEEAILKTETLLFSIIIVCLNPGKNLLRTVNSILTQDYQNYEIIVKDGLSDDDSISKLPISDKIHIYSTKDSGIYDAMNQAIELSKGKYLCFMNCGDCFYNNTILNLIHKKVINERDFYNVIYSNYQRNRVISKMPKELYDFYLYRTPLNHQSMYIGRDVFKKYGLYDLKYKILADYEHTLRIYRNNVKFIYCDCVSCDYLGGGVSESKRGIAIKEKEYKEITKKYFKKLVLFRYKFLIILSFKNIRGILSSDNTPLFLRKAYREMVNKINQ